MSNELNQQINLMDTIPNIKINGLEKTATLQITGGSPDTTGTNWMASYEVQDNDTGLVVFKYFHATDPSGNFITYANNSVRSPDNVTMDNRAPSVSSVELSTDNALAGTLYDDQNDTSKPHELVSRACDNITLKFETICLIIVFRENIPFGYEFLKMMVLTF